MPIGYHKEIINYNSFIQLNKENPFSQADFPALEQAMKVHKEKVHRTEMVKIEGETVEIDPVLGNIAITNPRLRLRMTLYRSSLYLTDL